MIWQRVRLALLASMVAMAAALPVAPGKALAGDCKTSDGKPCEVISSAPAAAPAMKTIRVTECVPEHYTTTRTVYKTHKVEEKYTAYRCEKVPETRTRTVTVYDKVPVEETRTRTICVNVPCVEERTCMEKHWVCKQVTTYKKKCVDKGHYECKTVECKPGLVERLCSKKKCDPCDPCCEQACPKTKTVKVWVPCKVWIDEPCTKTVRVCEHRPVKKQVTVCKKETRCETYKVTVCKCVPRQKVETYTCCVEKKIPYEATRIVCKSVPVQEQVTCCRMVKKCVEKQVPVCDPCCDTCSGKSKWSLRKSCCK